MRDDDLRAYAHRPWPMAEALKQAHWARELSRNSLATFEASQALRVADAQGFVETTRVIPLLQATGHRVGDVVVRA